MPSVPAKVLWISDNENADRQACRIAAGIRKTEIVFERSTVSRIAANGTLGDEHDAYLFDFDAQDDQTLKTIRSLRAKGHTAPIILLADGTISTIRAKAVEIGVSDCLDKRQLTPEKLERSVRFAVEHCRVSKALSRCKTRSGMESRLRSAMLIATGEKGCATFLDHRWLTFAGRRAEEEIGVGWTERVHPEDLAGCIAAITAAWESREEFRIEYRLQRSDGAYRWIRHAGVPLHDSGGQFVGHAGACADITNRRLVRQLRRARNYLQNIIDSSLDMIISVDSNRRIVEFNKAAQERLGYSAARMIGQSIELLYADPDEARRIHESIQATGSYSGEVTNRTRSGETFISHLEASRLHDQDGQFIGVMGISRDITRQKRIEEALRASEERFRVAQEMSLDAFTILDAVRDERGAVVDFRWVYVNPMAGRYLKHAPEELIGRQLLDVLPGNKTDSDLFDRYVRVVETGRSHDCELAYQSDGIRGWFRNMAVKLGDGIAVCFSDITARKHGETHQAALFAAVQKHHEDLLSILNQLRQGIFMTDRDGCIAFANQSCQCFFGDTVESFYGRPWTELGFLMPEDKAALHAMAQHAPGQRTRVPVGMRGPQGRRYVMEVDILDDPRDSDRKIFFIYDLTEIHELHRMLHEKQAFRGLIGQSPLMQAIFQLIGDLAVVDSTVLIEGETGTGKELVAQAIHASGPRSGKPLVPVNCAGLTESLIGSQLFGHKRGAFTGAIADHHGVFETANGGTVFLDEIGDLPLTMQTNLLRVLQEKEVTRIGESTPRRIDVRVIAATNQDLEKLVREGRFRQDLLYRIRVARIVVPPLRERREDIPLLVAHFLSESQKRINKNVTAISDDAMRAMLRYDWPGNVRELQSAIESACIGCKGPVVPADALPPELCATDTPETSMPDAEDNARERLLVAIRAAKGSRTSAARLLGVSRATLYRRLHDLQLDPNRLQ